MNIHTRGMSLIELMVVIAILAIIVAFGYPSYRDQVQKARRTEGIGELLELADRMERYYSDNGTYAGATAAGIFHVNTDKNHYQLNVDAADAVTFTVRATPQGSQSADKCGTFTLDSLGNRGLIGNSIGLEQCWK